VSVAPGPVLALFVCAQAAILAVRVVGLDYPLVVVAALVAVPHVIIGIVRVIHTVDVWCAARSEYWKRECRGK
jgi:hypothetical protein